MLRRRRMRILPVKILRLLTRILVIALFIPTLRILSTPLLCWTASDARPEQCISADKLVTLCVSGATLLLWIPYCVIVSLAFYDSNPTSAALDNRAHGRVQCLYLVVQILLVYIEAFGNRLPLSGFLICILCLLTYASMLILLPYYKTSMNALRCGLFLAAAVFAVLSACLKAVNESDTSLRGLISTIALGSIPAFFFVGYLSVLLRLRSLAPASGAPYSVITRDARAQYDRQTSPPSTANQMVAPASAANLLPTQTSYSITTFFVFVLEAQADLKARFCKTEAGAETMYGIAIHKFPHSGFLQISYATYLQAYRSKGGEANQHLQVAQKKCAPGIDLRFLIFSKLRDWEQQAQGGALGSSSINVVSMLEFRKLLVEASEQHNKCLKLIQKFWKSLLLKSKAARLITESTFHLEAIGRCQKAAKSAYTTLLRKFPLSKQLLRQYGDFLANVCNDRENGQAYLVRADELEEMERLLRTEASSEAHSELDSKSASSHSPSVLSKRLRTKTVSVLEDQADLGAVRRFEVGVWVGVLVLIGLSTATYVVAADVFTQYEESIFRIDAISSQQRYLISLCDHTCNINVAANVNDTATFAAQNLKLQQRTDLFMGYVNGLVYGFPEAPPSTDANVRASWFAVDHVTEFYVPGDPPTRVRRIASMWDLSNWFGSAARTMGNHSIAQMVKILTDPSQRFMMDVGVFALNAAIASTIDAYEDEVSTRTSFSIRLYAGLVGGVVGTLLLLVFALFRPSISKVQEKKRGVADILERIPAAAAKSVCQHYLRISRVSAQSDSSEIDPTMLLDSPSQLTNAADTTQEGSGELKAKRSVLTRDFLEQLSQQSSVRSVMLEQYRLDSVRARDPVPYNTAPPDPKPSTGTLPLTDVPKSRAAAAIGDSDADLPPIPGSTYAPVVHSVLSAVRPPVSGLPSALHTRTLPDSPAPHAAAGTYVLAPLDSTRGTLLGHPVPFCRTQSGTISDSGSHQAALDIRRGAPLHPPNSPSAPPASKPSRSKRSGTHRRRKESADETDAAASIREDDRGQTLQVASARHPAAAAPAASDLRTSMKGSRAVKNLAARSTVTIAADVTTKVRKASKAFNWQWMPHDSDKGDRVSGKRVDLSSRIFDKLTLRYNIAFALLALLSVAAFVTLFMFVGQGEHYGAEIKYAGKRRYAAREVAFLTNAITYNDGNVGGLSKTDLVLRMMQRLDDLQNYHQGMLYGNQTMRLAGSIGRYGKQDKMLFQTTCLRVDGQCATSMFYKPAMVLNGLDTLIHTYVGLGYSVLKCSQALDAAGNLNESASWYTDRAPHQDLNLPAARARCPDMKTLYDLHSDWIDGGLQLSQALYSEEARGNLQYAQTIEAVIVSVEIVAIVAVFVFTFRPIIHQLKEESGRSNQLLRMIPTKVVQAVPELHCFFSIAGAANDGPPPPSASPPHAVADRASNLSAPDSDHHNGGSRHRISTPEAGNEGKALAAADGTDQVAKPARHVTSPVFSDLEAASDDHHSSTHDSEIRDT